MSRGIKITDRLSIPEDEVTLTASRSSGPGGQHVNKVSSRVTLHFDVDASTALTERQKRRIRQRLARRISREGRLRVACQLHRSQAANRREVVERFADLLRAALRERPKRVKSAVPRAERQRRLEEKRRRARLKLDRAKPEG